MTTNVRVRLSNIYRYMDLPNGLGAELNIAYYRHKIGSEFPSKEMFIEVQNVGAIPEFILKRSLENLLSFYKMEKREDSIGEYYR